MSEAGAHASMAERINEKIHEYQGSSSSSDSENEKSSSPGSRKKRLFGRKAPLHNVFGGGKSADIILWRNKQQSGGILAGATVIWLLFEWIGYHLLTFICHSLICVLAVLFVWSNVASFLNRSPPKFPEVILPEDVMINIAQKVRYEINEAFATFRYIALGKDLKTFLMGVAGLWAISIVGNWFSFLTLAYIVFLTMYTGPVFYEMYEDQVDTAAEKALIEFNKHYVTLDEKVLQKIPRGPFTDKKQH